MHHVLLQSHVFARGELRTNLAICCAHTLGYEMAMEKKKRKLSQLGTVQPM